MTTQDTMDEARIEHLREQYRIAPRGYRAAACKALKTETTRQLLNTALLNAMSDTAQEAAE